MWDSKAIIDTIKRSSLLLPPYTKISICQFKAFILKSFMSPDDPVCLCFHVTRRKVTNFIRVEKPRRASQLSECFGAGTGCGWCRPYLERILNAAAQRDRRYWLVAIVLITSGVLGLGMMTFKQTQIWRNNEIFSRRFRTIEVNTRYFDWHLARNYSG